MQEPDIYATINGIFNDVFIRDDIQLTAEMTASDVEGWDSFKQIEIILALEEHYRMKFRTKEIDGLKNVGDLVKVVLSRS
jgi:acyl carrier protein